MFCENCGKPLGEDAKFCPECGAKNAVPEVSAETPAAVEMPSAEPAGSETPVSAPPVQTAPISFGTEETAKPKKKCGKKLIAVAAIAVVLAVAVAVSAFASPFVGNLIANTFRSPESYLGYVMQKGAEDFSDEFAAQLKLLRKPQATVDNTTGEFTFTMGDGMKNLLKEAGGSEAELITSWINSVGLGMDVAMQDSMMGLNADLSLNGTDLISGNVAIDGEGGMLYLTVPEISETGIGFPMGSEYNSVMESQTEAMELMRRMMDIIPEEDVLKKLICRYTDAVVGELDDVEKDVETIEAGGISQKLTVLTAEISEKTAMDIAEAVCREAKEDKEIKNIIKKAASIEEFGMDADEAYDIMQENIDDFLDEVDSYDASRETVCELKVYVNNRGEIVGIGAEVEEEAVEVSFCTVEKGRETGMMLQVTAPGTAVIFEGSGEEAGGKVSGTYELRYNDMKLAVITLSDVDDAKLAKGMLDGKISIALSEGLQNMLGMYDAEIAAVLKDARLDMTFTQDSEKEAGVEMSVYTGGTLFASVQTEVNGGGSGLIKLPASYINGEDERELEAWLANSGFKPADLVGKLRAAGMPEALASQLETMTNPVPEKDIWHGGEGTGIVDPRL